MSSTKQTVPFNGTKAQEEQLIKVIAELKSEPGALMPILKGRPDRRTGYG